MWTTTTLVKPLLSRAMEKKTLVLGTLSSTPHSPHSLLLKWGDENWKVIPGMSIKFGDVCRFKSRLYAVDKTGRTVAVGPDDSTVQLVAESLVGGGQVKFLVESKGDLLLVDVYGCARIGFPGHNPARTHLFKLNEKETEWVKLNRLGDIILFLGADCSFSASASDLSVAKGNCVIFLENVFPSFQHFGFDHFPRGLNRTTTGCVLDLDKHQLSPLSDYPEYFNLFPQPPEWIVKSCIRN